MMEPEQRGPWMRVGSRIGFENKWLTVQVDTVRTASGKEYEYNVSHFGSGSIIVPLDTEGNVYLAKEYRYGIDRVVVEAFAGGIEKGEDPLEAAKRELKEEGGITANKWTAIGGFSLLSGKSSSVENLFLAEDLTFGAQELEENEFIEIVKMPFEEALARVAKGEINSIQTALLLESIGRILRERDEK